MKVKLEANVLDQVFGKFQRNQDCPTRRRDRELEGGLLGYQAEACFWWYANLII